MVACSALAVEQGGIGGRIVPGVPLGGAPEPPGGSEGPDRVWIGSGRVSWWGLGQVVRTSDKLLLVLEPVAFCG